MQGLKLNNVGKRGPWSAPVPRMQTGMVVCLPSWWYTQMLHADPISRPHRWAMGCLLWIYWPPFPHPTSASVPSDAERYGGLPPKQVVHTSATCRPHISPSPVSYGDIYCEYFNLHFLTLPLHQYHQMQRYGGSPPEQVVHTSATYTSPISPSWVSFGDVYGEYFYLHSLSASVPQDAERYGGLALEQVVHTSATCRPHISPSWANYGDVYGEYFYLHSLSASVLQDAERYGGLALEQVVHTSATCTSHISPSPVSHGDVYCEYFDLHFLTLPLHQYHQMQRGMVVCLPSRWYTQVPHADPISHHHGQTMGMSMVSIFTSIPSLHQYRRMQRDMVVLPLEQVVHTSATCIQHELVLIAQTDCTKATVVANSQVWGLRPVLLRGIMFFQAF